MPEFESDHRAGVALTSENATAGTVILGSMNEPVSLRTKIQSIRDAALKEPPFPYNQVPPHLDIGEVARLTHKPAGDQRVRQQRIEAWMRDVDAAWKRLAK